MSISPTPAPAFDSGLSTPDFSACLAMGLQPIGLVQGYYVGQIASWTSYQAQVVRRYGCPHGYTQEPHVPDWIGGLADLDRAWAVAHQTALERMLAEAARAGAHGVVGVRTELGHPASQSSCEAHLYGTAVRVVDAPVATGLWSTELAGHKLAKLLEIGCVPDSVVYLRRTTALVEGCITEQGESGWTSSGASIEPLEDFHRLARTGLTDAVARWAADRSVYGVRLEMAESEGAGTTYLSGSLFGSVVRRVRRAMPLPPPLHTVPLT